MVRRKGRSQAIRVTCDSWRDSAGTLWQPNFTVLVDIGALASSLVPWVISEVHFMVDGDRGTVCDLLLMPRDAFQPQPIILRPDLWNPTDPAQGGAASVPAGGPVDRH
jgi:prophage tail gpP-like protein